MAQILLVDDERVARVMYGDFLTGAGHQVLAVGSLEEAKTAMGKQRFDLVVTDLIFPQSDGMELIQWVRVQHPTTEVLVITALEKVDAAVRAIKTGASDYLVKPIHPEVLAHACRRALTTRTMLKENVDLRRHVTLLEAAQRLASTLDRERLIHSAASAIGQGSRAQAALLLLKDGDSFKVQANWNVPEGDLEKLTEEVEAEVKGGFDPRGQELSVGLKKPLETAYFVPATEGDATLGAVVLLFEGDLVETNLQDAAFLGRHLGLALRNLGKFAEVEDLVYLDDLTHLFNRRYFDLVIDKEFKQPPPPVGKPFAVLFTDLDYFKSVNDTHGHVVGSKLLVEVARILKGCVRDGDVVCRYGGDEYLLLLRGTDSGGALKVAERIRRTIESHRFLAREGYSLTITTCIGVSSWPEHATDKATLVDFADRAMYRGKKGTRNIIYLAASGLEATPVSRHQTAAPEPEIDPNPDIVEEIAADKTQS